MSSAIMFVRQYVAAVLLGTISIVAHSSLQVETAARLSPAAVMHNPSAQTQHSAAELFFRLIEHNHWQRARLDRFSVVRTYTVEDDKGKTLAEEVAVMEYKAPGTKTFTTTSANGSTFIRGHVFKQLMKREAERESSRQDRDISITPLNYDFEMLGQEQVGSTCCTVVHAIPKRKESDLFEGKIWIDDQDFAIVKVAGHLAKSPSFWIKRVDFVRQYQKINGFWLPIREQSIAKVKIYGTKTLTIGYQDYKVSEVGADQALLTNAVGVHMKWYRRHLIVLAPVQ